MSSSADPNTGTSKRKEASDSAAQLFARPEGGERTLLIHPDFDGVLVEESVQEFKALAESAGADVIDSFIVRRQAPDARYLIGTGKAEEIAQRVADQQIDLVIINFAVRPAQERNLERLVKCRVLDRTGLILDIFAQRARSFEGKMQVELAQLRHMASRLVRGWSHLERQRGGLGLRGPGETQLELDRRMLGVRIAQLERRLEKVGKQREQGRQARRKRELPVVSLVGYTNAGKSTLFNTLTQSDVYAANQLFATLDTTLRRIELNPGQPVILADTVGFIRDLPHQLVAAFRSTLEEVVEADLLLHIVDAADDAHDQQMEQVDAVLAEIGANEVPVLKVYNKIDLLGRNPGIDRDEQGDPIAVWLSAVTGDGLGLLLEAIAERIGNTRVHGVVRLPPEQGRLRARFYALGQVMAEHSNEAGELVLEVDLLHRDLNRLYQKEGLSAPIEPLAPSPQA